MYELPKSLLSDSEKKFTSKFFHSVRQLLEATIVFTSTHHAQTNEQVLRNNRTLVATMRCYGNDNLQDWDWYASTPTHAYNSL